MKKKPAVFLDRDGTINIDTGYISTPSDFIFIEKAQEAIRVLKEHNFAVIVISNQSGVGRGFFTTQAVIEVNNYMERMLKQEGIILDGVYFCPHAPHEACMCRKPALGMVKQAQEEHNVDMKASYFIGDKMTDIETGKNAGCKTVLIAAEKDSGKIEGSVQADYVTHNLYEATQWIIDRGGRPR